MHPSLSQNGTPDKGFSMHAGITSDSPAMLDFSRAKEASYAEVMTRFSKFIWGAM
jgi:hypothetical protein